MPPSIPPSIFTNKPVANISPALSALRDAASSRSTFPPPPGYPYPAIVNTSLAFRTHQVATPKSPSRSPSPLILPPSLSLSHGSSNPHPNAFTGEPALPFRKPNNSKVSKQQQTGLTDRQYQRKANRRNKKFRNDMNEMTHLMGDTRLELPEPEGQSLHRERAAETIAKERIAAEQLPEPRQQYPARIQQGRERAAKTIARQRITTEQLPEPRQQYPARIQPGRERAAKTIARQRITEEIHGRKRAAVAAKPIDELIGGLSGIDLAKEVGAHLKNNSYDKKKEKRMKSRERRTERLAQWAKFGVKKSRTRCEEVSIKPTKRELLRKAEELGVEVPPPMTANRWAMLRGMVEEAQAKMAVAQGEVDKDGDEALGEGSAMDTDDGLCWD